MTVRFLELMRVGYANSLYEEHYVSAQECIARLQERYTLTPFQRHLIRQRFTLQSTRMLKLDLLPLSLSPSAAAVPGGA